jgi:hypothetical protein
MLQQQPDTPLCSHLHVAVVPADLVIKVVLLQAQAGSTQAQHCIGDHLTLAVACLHGWLQLRRWTARKDVASKEDLQTQKSNYEVM